MNKTFIVSAKERDDYYSRFENRWKDKVAQDEDLPEIVGQIPPGLPLGSQILELKAMPEPYWLEM